MSTVTITEVESGWTISGAQSGQWATAAEALAAVLRHDAAVAESGRSCVTVITWQTSTATGRRVARALQ